MCASGSLTQSRPASAAPSTVWVAPKFTAAWPDEEQEQHPQRQGPSPTAGPKLKLKRHPQWGPADLEVHEGSELRQKPKRSRDLLVMSVPACLLAAPHPRFGEPAAGSHASSELDPEDLPPEYRQQQRRGKLMLGPRIPGTTGRSLVT